MASISSSTRDIRGISSMPLSTSGLRTHAVNNASPNTLWQGIALSCLPDIGSGLFHPKTNFLADFWNGQRIDFMQSLLTLACKRVRDPVANVDSPTSADEAANEDAATSAITATDINASAEACRTGACRRTGSADMSVPVMERCAQPAPPASASRDDQRMFACQSGVGQEATASAAGLTQHQWSRSDLHRALSRNQFAPFYQPKIDLASGLPTCVEMLARWDHPDLGILPASQFIEAMEGEELVDRLTESLLHKSLRGIRRCSDRGWKVGLAINFSPLTLQDRGIPDRMARLLRQYRIAADQITIEVTETAASKDFDAMLKTLTQLRQQGFKISMDDFGMGYSSLHLLNRLPFTELKIDRKFVGGILKDSKSALILESIIHLASRLRMNTVAEGIETESEFNFIQSLGCTAGQGFYLGEPMTDENLVRYLERSRRFQEA